MATHKLVWTAMPNGVRDGKLKLSVLVSPRLSASQQEGDALSLWPQWVDWTTFISNATFKVAFDGGSTVDATFDKSVLEPALWQALFNAQSFVRPHSFDNYLDRMIISYPARRVHRSIKQLYQEAGTRAPEGLPANQLLTWDVEYVDFGTGNSPSAAVHGVAGSGRYIYATHHETDLEPPLDPGLPPGRLYKIDRETLDIVAQVQVGLGPRGIAVMPDRNDAGKNRIYVVNGGGALGAGASLMIIKETAAGFAQPLVVDLGQGLFQVAASFARNQVFVANGFGGRLFILDADTGQKQGEFTPDQPGESGLDVYDIAVDDEDALYLTLAEVGGLPTPPGTPPATTVVKLVPQGAQAYQRAWTTTIRRMLSTPPMLAVDSQRKRVYITHNRLPDPSPGVTILDSSTGAKLHEIEVAGQNSLNLAVSEHFGYTYNMRGSEVTIMTATGRIIGSIPHQVQMNFGDIAVLADSQQVLVGGDHSGKLMIATPSSTEVPGMLDDLLPGWEVPWTPEAEKAARDKLGSNKLEERDLTSRVLLFHRRPDEDEVKLPQTAQDFRTLLDFHEALSSLGDYPELLRKLGLVIDLELPIAGVPPGQRVVRVLPTLPQSPGPAIEHKSMATTATVIATSFAASSQSGEIVDGMLALDGERYELQQLDVDGATLKLVNTAATLGRVSPGDPLRKALPALRTSGIALVRDEHADALKQRFSRSLAHDNALAEGEDSVLFAEDLVRGYRIDVRDGTSNTWRSLCRRVGSYQFNASGQTLTRSISDEGIVEVGATEAAQPKPGAPNDLYLHEAVARWDGYSLVAGRPGKSSGEDGQPVPDSNTPATPFKLRVDFVPAPKSLPRLRFGEEYEMRARVVDLAGNSISLENAPDTSLPQQPGRFAYLRYEVVPAPAVVLRRPITEQTTPGEALERLVLRTTNTRLEQDMSASSAIAERHIAAPRASQLFVETHGVLDRDGALQAGVYSMLARRDAGQFPVDVATDMPVDGTAQLALPYLADPLSEGATLRELPGAPSGAAGRVEGGKLVYRTVPGGIPRNGSATQLGWDAQWPERLPFRLLVRDGTSAPEWNAATRLLTVSLPKAALARVQLSSFMRERDLKLMAVWTWLREYADERTRALAEKIDIRDADALDQLAKLLGESAHYALFGGHALLTPSRELVLVHAVQQPLGRPVWSELDTIRAIGKTVAKIAGGLQIHARSTDSVELRARWDEPVDEPSAGPPEIRPNNAVVVELPIPLPVSPFNPNQPFTTIKVGGRRLARLYAAEDRLEFVSGAQPEQAFGDTKYRVVRYRAAATSRFREYFAPDAPGGFERESDEVVVRLPSSARPAAPRVRYAVPIFGWERAGAANIISSRRRGHGLRVFLDRPWYSSGEGELLGVVILPRTPTDDERKKLKGFISQAGADPVFVSSGRAALNDRSFGSEGITWGRELRLQGINDRVDVAGHAVEYDAERDLYFCDIAFDPSIGRDVEAYGAFVQLALVRFQPDSLSNLELSRAVTTEFMQVAPDRSAVVTYDPYDPGLVQLVVAGQTYRTTLGENNQPRADGTFVQVSVEERRSDVSNELGWRPAQAKDVAIDAGQTNSTETLLWRGTIRLPAARRPGTFRLVIKEFEPWLDDGALESANSIQLGPRARRLVYAETLEV